MSVCYWKKMCWKDSETSSWCAATGNSLVGFAVRQHQLFCYLFSSYLMHLKSQKLWSSQTLPHVPLRNSLTDINRIHCYSANSDAQVFDELEHNQTTHKGICTKHEPSLPFLLPTKPKHTTFIHRLNYCSTPALLLLFSRLCWCLRWCSCNLFRLQSFFWASSTAYLGTLITFTMMGLTSLLTFCSATVP